MSHAINLLGMLLALGVALGALFTTPRRATVQRLREQLTDLRGYVADVERRLAEALRRLGDHEQRIEETETTAMRRRQPERRAS